MNSSSPSPQMAHSPNSTTTTTNSCHSDSCRRHSPKLQSSQLQQNTTYHRPRSRLHNLSSSLLLSLLLSVVLISVLFSPNTSSFASAAEAKQNDLPFKPRKFASHNPFAPIQRKGMRQRKQSKKQSKSDMAIHSKWQKVPFFKAGEVFTSTIRDKLRRLVKKNPNSLSERQAHFSLAQRSLKGNEASEPIDFSLPARRERMMAARAAQKTGQGLSTTDRPLTERSNLPLHQRFAPVDLKQLEMDSGVHPRSNLQQRTRSWYTPSSLALSKGTEESLVIAHATDRPCSNSTDEHKNAIWVEYTGEIFYCNGELVTESTYRRKNELSHWNCTMEIGPLRACFCPQDRYGLTCENEKQTQCNTWKESPHDDCLTLDGVSDAETQRGGVEISSSGRNCLRYRTNDKATFRFRMNCTTNVDSINSIDASRLPQDVIYRNLDEGGRNMTWNELIRSFDYFLAKYPIEDTGVYGLALTRPADDGMFLNPVNFYDFSDVSSRVGKSMDDPDYYTAEKPFNLGIDLSTVKRDYYSGNRLYLEVGYPTLHPVILPILYPIFIDFPELYDPKYEEETWMYFVIPAILLLMVLALLACCVGYGYRRYRHKKAMKVD